MSLINIFVEVSAHRKSELPFTIYQAFYALKRQNKQMDK